MQELDWTRKACQETPKSFQVWYHRQEIFLIHHSLLPQRQNEETCQALREELENLDEQIFTLDAKNYHAWSYRIWFIKKFITDQQNDDLLIGELESTAMLIENDPFNNSAWNFRYFILSQPTSKMLIEKEEEMR